MNNINRRDFLKLMGSVAPLTLFPSVSSLANVGTKQNSTKPNVIILLFDAMTSRNLSLYGYKRPTTSNFERFAQRATVYHSHYSGGNYTIPGTSTLLTGTYPWTSRALNYSGGVLEKIVENNIFRAFGDEYHRLAFPQSMMANFIVSQFTKDIDTFLPAGAFGNLDSLTYKYFPKDQNMALRALDDFMLKMDDKPSSMVFGAINWSLYYRESERLSKSEYPKGLPHNVTYPLYFDLENLLDGVASLIPSLPEPFFTYLHLYPPHAPYRATKKFDGKFIDGWGPIDKPVHPLSEHSSKGKLLSTRRSYDEYIASLDWEFGNLMDAWTEAGVLENSYVIITSDHGEIFERGETRHTTPLLFDPVVRIPLLISAPGQQTRKDIYAPTNAVDILPTLMQLLDKPTPPLSEGKPLPGLGGVEDYARSTFTVEAKRNPAFAPLDKSTVAMRRDGKKLIYYSGYGSEPFFELYDLENDIEELEDLYPQKPSFFTSMREELLESLHDADKPYTK